MAGSYICCNLASFKEDKLVKSILIKSNNTLTLSLAIFQVRFMRLFKFPVFLRHQPLFKPPLLLPVRQVCISMKTYRECSVWLRIFLLKARNMTKQILHLEIGL